MNNHTNKRAVGPGRDHPVGTEAMSDRQTPKKARPPLCVCGHALVRHFGVGECGVRYSAGPTGTIVCPCDEFREETATVDAIDRSNP